jgi:hypothetical protein
MLKQEEQTSYWELLIQVFSRIKMDNLSVMTKQQICI